MFLRNQQPVKPLPYWAYFTPVLIITVVGLGTTLYLSIAHYRVYLDMDYKSFCAISQAINCDTVSQSAYAVFLGMPLAVWGAIGYLFMLLLLLYCLNANARPQRFWASIQTLSFLFCGFDLYLAWVSSYRIHSYCIMCIVTYGVNFSLLYYSWLIRRRFNQGPWGECLRGDISYFWAARRYTVPVFSGLIAVALSGMLFYPGYWHYKLPEPNGAMTAGHTEEGFPWIGARSPKLVIEEYSDYLCFQCAKMHAFLRELIARYPDKIRLVHRHFPMDKAYNPLVKKSFHDGAGQMALLALYAEKRGRFWEMNDLLFESGRKREPVGIRDLAKRLELEFGALARAKDSSELKKLLWRDIRSGLKHRIIATPTFLVNGKVYQGTIPAEVLQFVID
jgi:uncharacterized membrane protein/protein-disulfide isomerase